jgi:phospholipase C
MLKIALARWFGLLGVSLAALALSQGVRAEDGPDHAAQNLADPIKTASPIKHVIIIVGENRSFDHLFATYMPKSHDERVLNLLSERIVKADGTPNENFDRAHQFQITSAPNGRKFFISAGSTNKSLYSMLPAPDLNGVQNPPAAAILGLPGGDPGLPAADQFLFGTGGRGLPNNEGPDIRITNVNTLPPGPFQMTGPTMPYDAYTGDTIHQFFQMYQQLDCAIDKEHVTRRNPTGCLHDLQSAITTTFSTAPGGTPHDTGRRSRFSTCIGAMCPI